MTLKPLSLPPPPLMGTTPPQHRGPPSSWRATTPVGTPRFGARGRCPPPHWGRPAEGRRRPPRCESETGAAQKGPWRQMGTLLPLSPCAVVAVAPPWQPWWWGWGSALGRVCGASLRPPRPHFSPSPRPISPVPISRYVPNPTSPRSRFLRPHVPGVPAPHPLVPPSPNPVLPIS